MLSRLDVLRRLAENCVVKPDRRSYEVHRLPAGAQLWLSEAATILIVQGACVVRTAGKVRRVGAGAVLLRGSARSKRDRNVSRALELMAREPARSWTVERLARAVGLSRAAFARRFSAASGKSPRRYLTELRLALGAALLEDTDSSLAEVALRVGYASEFAFSRAFKRRYGVAPSRFRRPVSGGAPVLLAA